jgi:hypothetical protein
LYLNDSATGTAVSITHRPGAGHMQLASPDFKPAIDLTDGKIWTRGSE